MTVRTPSHIVNCTARSNAAVVFKDHAALAGIIDAINLSARVPIERSASRMAPLKGEILR